MSEGTAQTPPKDKGPKKCLIFPLPKVVFFYPTALAAFLCAVTTASFKKDVVPQAVAFGYLNHDKIGKSKDRDKLQEAIVGEKVTAPKWDEGKNRDAWREASKDIGAVEGERGVHPGYLSGWLFLIIFTLNVLVISFEFPGVKALAVTFLVIAVVTGGALLNMYYPFLPFLSDWLRSIHPYATGHFYLYLGILFTVIIAVSVFINRYWNRWIIESNRLVHKHGMLGNVREWPVMHLEVTKEITDIFEFCLLMSGSLVFKTGNPNERPIVLENVPWINTKEKQIRGILESFRIGVGG
ncbi:MAG: hypothetical protein HY720_24400 [Planctomycetes bacterium]|nr:hypothetical protein [Planctomycetota bacterium]